MCGGQHKHRIPNVGVAQRSERARSGNQPAQGEAAGLGVAPTSGPSSRPWKFKRLCSGAGH